MRHQDCICCPVHGPDASTEQEVELARVMKELARASSKWRGYEREYVLPPFKWAEEIGFDLRAAVRNNPGKNCAKLLFEHMRERMK